MTKHGTILLVEDAESEPSLIAQACAEAGICNRLPRVHSSREAIKYLRGDGKYANRIAHPLPFLVLLDLTLPDEDGFALLRWLQARPGLTKKFTVIVLNAAGANQDIQLAYELGAQSYLLKPSDQGQLVAAMRRVKEYWIDLNRRSEDEV